MCGIQYSFDVDKSILMNRGENSVSKAWVSGLSNGTGQRISNNEVNEPIELQLWSWLRLVCKARWPTTETAAADKIE